MLPQNQPLEQTDYERRHKAVSSRLKYIPVEPTNPNEQRVWNHDENACGCTETQAKSGNRGCNPPVRPGNVPAQYQPLGDTNHYTKKDAQQGAGYRRPKSEEERIMFSSKNHRTEQEPLNTIDYGWCVGYKEHHQSPTESTGQHPPEQEESVYRTSFCHFVAPDIEIMTSSYPRFDLLLMVFVTKLASYIAADQY
jgi:hypothetical protein